MSRFNQTDHHKSDARLAEIGDQLLADLRALELSAEQLSKVHRMSSRTIRRFAADHGIDVHERSIKMRSHKAQTHPKPKKPKTGNRRIPMHEESMAGELSLAWLKRSWVSQQSDNRVQP